MRILLAGATGFIGGHLLRTFREAGHEVRAIARRPGAARPGVEWVVGDFATAHTPGEWAAAVAGCDVVVNAVGIIREAPGQTFSALHERGPAALFAAGAAAGARLVQISALGCDDVAREPYFRHRRVVDRQVLAAGGFVLRPSFVWGPGDHSMRMFRSMAALPVVPVVGDGGALVRPVHVADLARAVRLAAEGDGPPGAWDVVGAEAMPFASLFDVLRVRIGRRAPAWKLHVPVPVMRVVAQLTAALGRGPITPDELSMLLRGSTAPVEPFAVRFGFVPRGLRAGLVDEPGADREATLAEVDALVPWLRLTAGSIWIATPLATWFGWPRAESLALLSDAGISGPMAPWLVDATCVVELGLGVATFAGWRLAWVGGAQLALVLGFTAVLAATGSPLWGHPFGPITKNIPLVGAILAVIATRDRSVR